MGVSAMAVELAYFRSGADVFSDRKSEREVAARETFRRGGFFRLNYRLTQLGKADIVQEALHTCFNRRKGTPNRAAAVLLARGLLPDGAVDERQRTVDDCDDFADADVGGIAQQPITARRTGVRCHQ